MYRGLYFKIILILVIFILIVMSVVGAVLISSVLGYYNEQFSSCMAQNLEGDAQLRQYLEAAMADGDADFAAKQKSILASYASRLGITSSTRTAAFSTAATRRAAKPSPRRPTSSPR